MADEMRPTLSQLKNLQPISEQNLSSALVKAMFWFEKNMYYKGAFVKEVGMFNKSEGKTWNDKLTEAIEDLLKKKPMPEQKMRKRVVFWVVFRSLLKMLEGYKIEASDSITGLAYIPKTSANNSKDVPISKQEEC